MGFHRRPNFLFYFLSPLAPQFFFTSSFTAAFGGGFPSEYRKRLKRGAKGDAPPEDERNPAEGGCFKSNEEYYNEEYYNEEFYNEKYYNKEY